MISVIKIDNRSLELMKKQPKQEIKIGDISIYYRSGIIEYLCVEGYRKTNTDDFYYRDFLINSNEPIELYVIFNTQVPEVVITLNSAQFKLLQPHLFSYGIVDAEKSIKYSTIFYTSE